MADFDGANAFSPASEMEMMGAETDFLSPNANLASPPVRCACSSRAHRRPVAAPARPRSLLLTAAAAAAGRPPAAALLLLSCQLIAESSGLA